MHRGPGRGPGSKGDRENVSRVGGFSGSLTRNNQFIEVGGRGSSSGCYDTLDALDEAEPDPDGCFGPRVELDATKPALPTLALHMQKLSAGTTTTRFRSSANYLYLVMEGSGRSIIDGKSFDWQRGDVLAVPCWRPVVHEIHEDAILFSASDEPVQRLCGYLREERGEAVT